VFDKLKPEATQPVSGSHDNALYVLIKDCVQKGLQTFSLEVEPACDVRHFKDATRREFVSTMLFDMLSLPLQVVGLLCTANSTVGDDNRGVLLQREFLHIEQAMPANGSRARKLSAICPSSYGFGTHSVMVGCLVDAQHVMPY